MGAKRQPAWIKGQLALQSQEQKIDWRVGFNVTPILRSHYLFHEIGVVEQVFPTGHLGIDCGNGVLQIRMISAGLILFDAADDWRTA